MARKLTPKQQAVVDQLLLDPCLKTAAQVVGCNYDYVRKLATRDHIQDILQQKRDEVSESVREKVAIDAAGVLQRAMVYLETSITDFLVVPENGDPYFDFSKATPEQLRVIDGVEISPSKFGTRIKVTMPRKKEMLELIGKHCAVNAFKGDDDEPTQTTQNWRVTIVNADGSTQIIGSDQS